LPFLFFSTDLHTDLIPTRGWLALLVVVGGPIYIVGCFTYNNNDTSVVVTLSYLIECKWYRSDKRRETAFQIKVDQRQVLFPLSPLSANQSRTIIIIWGWGLGGGEE